MTKPMFVETSVGWINLSLVWRIQVSERTKIASIWYDASHSVDITIDDWYVIYKKIAEMEWA
jgi:hypothetical protein